MPSLVRLASLLYFVCDVVRSVRFSLDGRWSAHNSNRSIRVPCIVPGGIYTDLKRAGVIEEPYWGFNDMNYEWVAHENWTFYRDFKVPANLLRYNEVVLVAHGIDTVCNVTLNGVALLEARNMFVRYEASVKSSLKGRNRIRVQCESPVAYARRMHERQQAEYPVYPLCPSPAQGGQCHVNFIRKMPCSFGWDWAPSFPSTGIWKSIEIEAYNEVVIRDVTVTTPQRRLRGGQKWIIELTVFYKRSTRAPRNGTIRVSLNNSLLYAGSVLLQSSEASLDGRLKLSLAVPRTIKVQPWWPTGYGSQNLYCLNVTLYGKKEASQKTAMFGFRTVRINEEEIENTNGGTEFYFEINGVPIYAKGSNWVPADIFPERATSDYVEDLLISAKDANMNMLRVWGGGVYETDDFYDKADELGILIWQDMMFSTSLYPADSAFLQSVATEVEQQVRRLQRHPSLVVWVGNNENEEAMAYVWWDGVSDRMEQYVDDYKKLYVGTVKEVIDKEDTSRPFLPSTPSSGRLTARQGWISHDPNSHLSGDKHHYDYVANAWVPSSYPGARFVSEFGLQSYPSRETMKRVAAARMLTFPLSTFLDHRQHQMQGAEHVVSGIGLHFSLMLKGEPALTNKQKAYDVFAFLSQIVQAEGVRTGCEAFRRWRGHLLQAEGSGHNMGVLFWQLNDIWPAPSWSAIEYGGRWKMLQYFAKRFFSPVLVSPYVSDLSLRVFIINDHLWPLERAVLNLTIYKWSSFDPVYTKTLHLSVPKAAALDALTVRMSEVWKASGCSRASCFLWFTLYSASTGSHLAPEAYLLPSEPSVARTGPADIVVVSVTGPRTTNADPDVDTFDVHIRTDNIALFVWLNAGDLSGRFSDNGFLLKDRTKVIEFYTSEENVTCQGLRERITIDTVANYQTT